MSCRNSLSLCVCVFTYGRFRRVKLTQAGWTIFHEEGNPDNIVAVIGNHFYDVFTFISGAMPLDGEIIVKPLRIIYPTNRIKKVSVLHISVILLIFLFSLMHSVSRHPRPNWRVNIHTTVRSHWQPTMWSGSGSGMGLLPQPNRS
jgi:hypothetical protein